MKKIKKLSIVGILIIVLLPASGLQAQNQKSAKEKTPLAELKLKVFEGIREGRVEPIKAVTSSFWQYTLSASIKSEDTSEKEESQLQRVFNLKAVRLLTEANLSWTQIGAKDFHIFQLDNKEYAIIITLVRIDHPEKITGRIEVMEQNGEMKVSLLDSELSLYKNVITTLGFEDKSGQPYFLSLKVQNIRPVGIAVIPIGGEKVEVTPKVPAGGATGGVIGSQSVESLLFIDAVRAIGEIKPPKLIKKVDPVYPEEARKAGVEGIVILEVTTDQFGRVASVRVLKSVPLLDEAAIDAVKQWVYEPVIIDGKPKPIVFTVTVNFQLKEK
ncbi:MAG: energy transducer TonB [Candidatus Saccharicenans sp.]